MRYLGLLILATLLSSCSTFNDSQSKFIDGAIPLQSFALGDPRFESILSELDANNDIIWDQRLNDAAAQEASSYPNKVSWLIYKYRTEGALPRQHLKAYTKWWWPWSSTTAVASYGTDTVKLNLLKFNENEFVLANTFIHERNHKFGLIHKGQTRKANNCDPGYLSGDLGEALIRSSKGDISASPHIPVCPALCSALEKRGLWSACENGR